MNYQINLWEMKKFVPLTSIIPLGKYSEVLVSPVSTTARCTNSRKRTSNL